MQRFPKFTLDGILFIQWNMADIGKFLLNLLQLFQVFGLVIGQCKIADLLNEGRFQLKVFDLFTILRTEMLGSVLKERIAGVTEACPKRI